MNNCFLVAFNKQLRRIELNQDMLNASDDFEKLKHIDSFTSKYDEEPFKNYLLKKGIIENIDTPICIVNQKENHRNEKEINIYRVINSGLYNKYLSNSSELLDIFQKLYDSDNNYKEIANFIINEDKINRIFYFNGHSGKTYKLDYDDVRNIVLSLNIFNKYKKLELFNEKNNDYLAHKDEINSLLSNNYNI